MFIEWNPVASSQFNSQLNSLIIFHETREHQRNQGQLAEAGPRTSKRVKPQEAAASDFVK